MSQREIDSFFYFLSDCQQKNKKDQIKIEPKPLNGISENGECSQIDPPLINGTNGQIQEEVARELAKKVRLIRTFSMLVVVEVFFCFFFCIFYESKVSRTMVNCDAL